MLDINYLGVILKDTDSVDEILKRLTAIKQPYLTPKALTVIYSYLKDKNCASGLNKWVEFCQKIKITDDVRGKVEDGTLEVAIFVKWGNPHVEVAMEDPLESVLQTGKKVLTDVAKLALTAAII